MERVKTKIGVLLILLILFVDFYALHFINKDMRFFSFILLFCWIVLCTACNNKSDKSLSITTKTDTILLTSELPSQTIVTDTTLNDTIFLYRETNTAEYYHYHAIYIDTNHHSREYNRLTDFKFGSYEDDFQSNYNSIKEIYPSGYKVKNKTNLPKNWLPVYKYKGNYYLYLPSEGGYLGRLIINDSSWVDWGIEGPFPFPFQAIKQKTRDIIQYLLKIPLVKHLNTLK